MNANADKTQENKSQSVANTVSQKSSSCESTFQFVDNRSEAIKQRKLQKMANNRSLVKHITQLQAITDNNFVHKKKSTKNISAISTPNNPQFNDMRSLAVAQRKMIKKIQGKGVLQLMSLKVAEIAYPHYIPQITSIRQDVITQKEAGNSVVEPTFEEAIKRGMITLTPAPAGGPIPKNYHFGINDSSQSTPFARLGHRWNAIANSRGTESVAEFPFHESMGTHKYTEAADKDTTGRNFNKAQFDDPKLTPFSHAWNESQGKVLGQGKYTGAAAGARYSKGALVHTIMTGRIIKFHLDQMVNISDILSKKAGTPHLDSVTSKEIRYVQRFWEKDIPEAIGQNGMPLQFNADNVKFFNNGVLVPKPWK